MRRACLLAALCGLLTTAGCIPVPTTHQTVKAHTEALTTLGPAQVVQCLIPEGCGQ